jgi:hypothetical protein
MGALSTGTTHPSFSLIVSATPRRKVRRKIREERLEIRKEILSEAAVSGDGCSFSFAYRQQSCQLITVMKSILENLHV